MNRITITCDWRKDKSRGIYMTKKKTDDLLEWYDGYDGNDFGGMAIKPPPCPNAPPAEEPEAEKEPEKKAEQEVERIENSAELYKAAAIAKALESKIMMLSGVFDIDDDKKTKVKTEIKELAKKVEEIVSKI